MTAATIAVKDGAGNLVQEAVDANAGVDTPMFESPAFDNFDMADRITTVQTKWRSYFFTGNLLKWDVTQGSAATAASAFGQLILTSGTTLDDTVMLVSKQTFTSPFRSMFSFSMSQRIVGCTLFFEMVSVDPTTLQPDEQNIAAWRLDGITATAGIYEVACFGSQRQMSPATTITTTASAAALEIEPFTDEAWFHSRPIDSTNARAFSQVKHQQVPDANRLYKLRIRLVNRQQIDSISSVANNGSGLIRIVRNAHGYTTGDSILVRNLTGITGWVDGSYTVTVIDANTIDLQGSTFAGAWVNAGWSNLSKNLAPLSSTTVNVGFVSCTDYIELTTEITSGRGNAGDAQAMRALVTGGNVVNVAPGNPVAVGMRTLNGLTAAVGGGGLNHLAGTTGGCVVNKPYNIPETDWQYAAPAGGLAVTTATALKAASGSASYRNYLTNLVAQNIGATAMELTILDAATVIFRTWLPASMAAPEIIAFPTPLRALAANQAMNYQLGAASSAVYVNAQGYTAP